MATYQDIIIKREDLYKEVWSTPVAQLAKKYNISDVGLAKICKKMEIPRPGRGFWAKAESGARMQMSPLKPLSTIGKSHVLLNRAMQKQAEMDRNPEIIKIVEFEKQAENRIEIVEKPKKLHPLVAETRRQLLDAKAHNGRLALVPTCLDVRVSKGTLARAIPIMDAIVRAAEERGYNVAVDIKEGKNATFVASGKDRVFFYIEEIVQSVPHVETNAEKKERLRMERIPYMERITERLDHYASIPRSDYHPQGTLCLRLDHYYPSSVQRSWTDGKLQRVESCLNNFFISLQKIIDYERDYRLKREREEQERRDAAERQRIHEEKLRVEKAKAKRLKTELEGWETSRRIRTYLTAMRGNGDLTPDQMEWFVWAEQYANHLDPTIEFRIEVLDDA